jgi:hypothetical protein
MYVERKGGRRGEEETTSRFFIHVLSYFSITGSKEVLTIAINDAETILASACDTDIFIWYDLTSSLSSLPPLLLSLYYPSPTLCSRALIIIHLYLYFAGI